MILLFSKAQLKARLSAMMAPRRLPFQPGWALSHASTTSGRIWCGRSEPYRSSKEVRNFLYHSKVRAFVVVEAKCRKAAQDVRHLAALGRRDVGRPLGHQLVEELVRLRLGVLALGRGALAELVLPAPAALAELHDPPAVVLAEEGFLGHRHTSDSGHHGSTQVSRKVRRAHPLGGPVPGGATIFCYKNAANRANKRAAGFTVTACYVAPCGDVGARGFEPPTS